MDAPVFFFVLNSQLNRQGGWVLQLAQKSNQKKITQSELTFNRLPRKNNDTPVVHGFGFNLEFFSGSCDVGIAATQALPLMRTTSRWHLTPENFTVRACSRFALLCIALVDWVPVV